MIQVVRTDSKRYEVRQDGQPLKSESGRKRSFSTKSAAMAAAIRAAGITYIDERNTTSAKVTAALKTADATTLAKVAATLGVA